MNPHAAESRPQRPSAPSDPAGPQGDEPLNMEYSDSLLLDLFHLDYKNFFTRYRVDFWGFVLSVVLVFALVGLTKFLAMLGS